MRSFAIIARFIPPDEYPDNVFPRHNLAILREEFRGHRLNHHELRVKIYPYRGLLGRVACGNSTCRVSLHPRVAGAGAEMFQAFLHCLFHRLTGRPPDLEMSRRMSAFNREVREAERLSPRRQTGRAPDPQGRQFDLLPIFQGLNRTYFDDQIEVAGVGWTLRPIERKLAYFRPDARTIWVNRALDHPGTPVFLLEYLLYHEMLHALIPPRPSGKRLLYHHRQFREMERAFPHYELAHRYLAEVRVEVPATARRRRLRRTPRRH